MTETPVPPNPVDPKTQALLDRAAKKAARPWYMKKRFWVLGVVGLFLIIGVAGGGDDSGSTSTAGSSTSSSTSQESTEPQTEEPAAEEPKAEEPELTGSQRNAVESAANYLSFTAFSRSGLIKQLEFEDYSKADAEFAVDYLKVDWNEQAAKSAENYLDFTSFSRNGLIDQLKFEGFTDAQAKYGADQAEKAGLL